VVAILCYVGSQANGESWKRVEAALLYAAIDREGSFLVNNKGTTYIGIGMGWGCTWYSSCGTVQVQQIMSKV